MLLGSQPLVYEMEKGVDGDYEKDEHVAEIFGFVNDHNKAESFEKHTAEQHGGQDRNFGTEAHFESEERGVDFRIVELLVCVSEDVPPSVRALILCWKILVGRGRK